MLLRSIIPKENWRIEASTKYYILKLQKSLIQGFCGGIRLRTAHLVGQYASKFVNEWVVFPT